MWYMNNDRELMRAAAQEFSEKEVRPLLHDMEFEDKYPDTLVKRMGELGFTGLPYPEELGGCGSDWLTYGIVVEEIAKVSSTTALILLLNTCMTAMPINMMGTPEQKKRFLEPFLVCDKEVIEV